MSDVLEMSVFEAGGIFEAKPQHSIETNVRRPDEGKRQELPLRCENDDSDPDSRCQKRVNTVVNHSADSGIDEIAQHEKIRGEKENSEQNPTRMALAIDKDAYTQYRYTFEAKQKRRFCEHKQVSQIYFVLPRHSPDSVTPDEIPPRRRVTRFGL